MNKQSLYTAVMMLGAGLLCAWRSDKADRFHMSGNLVSTLNDAVPIEQPLRDVPVVQPLVSPASRQLDPRELLPQMKEVFAGEGVPSSLVWIAEVESSWNPRAVSPSGAVGLFQFMPETAERFGLMSEHFDGRVSPLRSARAAATYLRLLQDRFGSWRLSVAAYHAGEGRVERLMKTHGIARGYDDIASALPPQTQHYVAKVEAAVFRHEGVTL